MASRKTKKPEMKYFTATNTIVPLSGTNVPVMATYLGTIAQGVGSSNRIGRQIRLHRYRVTMVHSATTAGIVVSCGAAWIPEDEESAATIFPALGDGISTFASPSVLSVDSEFSGTPGRLENGNDSLVGVWRHDQRVNRIIRYTSAGTVLGADVAFAVTWSASSNITTLKVEYWFTDE